jgi:hypothetical protein
MPRLSGFLDGSVSAIPGVDMSQVRKARRVQQVRAMWSGLVDPVFLEHTNNVFVFERDGHREMHVYVDESIYAAELNNQRELIRWRCREEYGEDIAAFHIHISRGRYKSHHPFAEAKRDEPDQNPPVPLSEEEMEQVERTCETIPDERLKACFKKAMISDLEWKKGNK